MEKYKTELDIACEKFKKILADQLERVDRKPRA